MTRLRGLQRTDLLRRRESSVDESTLSSTRQITENIRSGRESAALAVAVSFGDIPTTSTPVVIPPSMLRAALESLPSPTRDVLEAAASSIRAFAQAQRRCLVDLERTAGDTRSGHRVQPIEAAGCYAPGGRYPLPSSALMTAITARVAGVDRVWVASPRPSPETLAAAALAEADGLLALGGIPAIVAFADGLFGVPKCSAIVGPGNRWVTAAKMLVRDRVTIDMIAGPSELLIIADHTANPAIVAADLLAQAEHDPDAVPVLITTHQPLVTAVETELARQLSTLPTRQTAEQSLINGGCFIACSLDEAIQAAEDFAPEHLELLVADARAVEPSIRNAGTVFIGQSTAEVFGDYGFGPNHTLPTGGWARLTGGLSVFTFLKFRTFLETSSPAREPVARAAAFARLEGLEGHARAAELRASDPAAPAASASHDE